ncbi:MAG: nuclear transport factor 2 family protein [Pseudomonadota bacterium]
MHPTIERALTIVASGDHDQIATLLAEDVTFKPPTYYATWTGREPVAAVLGHVGAVFQDFRYRRVMGADLDWALEFECKVGDLDAVGVDLLTLNDEGLIATFEVAMRPIKTISALREAMNARVMKDPRFLAYKSALRQG